MIIDNSTCTLSLLVDNLNAHMMRFRGRAAYLLLSSRRGALQGALSEIFDGSVAPLCILDCRTVAEATDLICASEFVFFTDAETEILSSFFVLALNLLHQRGPAVVSCAVAVRGEANEAGEIEHLPASDVPGVAALGDSTGSSVWGVTAASLAKDLSALALYDPQLDAFATSSVLGELLILQCRTHGVPVYTLPIVGAKETRSLGAVERRKSIKEARSFAVALGITPSVYLGGAPWVAISASCEHLEKVGPTPVECSEYLGPEHPLSSASRRSEMSGMDLPLLAAALGRADLSLQLEAANGPQPGRVRRLIDITARAKRLRPAWDLADVLKHGSVVEFGLTPVPKLMHGRNKLRPQSPTLSKFSTAPTDGGAIPAISAAHEARAGTSLCGCPAASC